MEPRKKIIMTASLLVSGALLIALGVIVSRNIEKNWFPESENQGEIPGEETAAPAARPEQEVTETPDDPAPACPEALAAEISAKGTAYVEGSILVTFAPAVDFSEAKSFLGAKGLRAASNAREDDFENSHWLTVTVPKGEEFDWICALRTAVEVNYAGINPTFKLAE